MKTLKQLIAESGLSDTVALRDYLNAKPVTGSEEVTEQIQRNPTLVAVEQGLAALSAPYLASLQCTVAELPGKLYAAFKAETDPAIRDDMLADSLRLQNLLITLAQLGGDISAPDFGKATASITRRFFNYGPSLAEQNELEYVTGDMIEEAMR